MKSPIIIVLGLKISACAFPIHIVAEKDANWTIGQTVQTTSGPVFGHPASNDPQVSEYLGIPYAQPPIGELRFEPPVPFTGTALIDGAALGRACPFTNSVDSFSVNMNENNGEHGEHCLYVNIWTKPQAGDAKKPAMVWIHGGPFMDGSCSIPAYNGGNIAEHENVIAVSFNYRLSILGFPGKPLGTQNLGLLDQRLALAWIRDNIARFGGDPARITLFGHSAGFSFGLPHSAANTVAAWLNVTPTLGCGNFSSNSTGFLAKMRSQSYQDKLNVIPSAKTSLSMPLCHFALTMENAVVYSNSAERRLANMSLLVGDNNYQVDYHRDLGYASDAVDVLWDDFDIQVLDCPAGIRSNASVAANNPLWCYPYFVVSSESEASYWTKVPILFYTAVILQ